MILDYVSNANIVPFEQRVFRDFSSELQWSPNFTIAIVLKGSLTIHYKTHNRHFATHDIYFFPPFETFSVIDSEPQTSVLMFSIDSLYVNKLCPNVTELTLLQYHLHFNLSDRVYCALCNDFATIIFNNLKNETCSKLKLLCAVTNILTVVFENFGIIMESEEKKDYTLNRNTAIFQYLNDHYMEKITVTDIASHLGLHPQYFSTFFHKQFGTTFIDYLNTYRINHSISDLIYTDESILDIALNHGFGNHKTYAATFKKLYNTTPTEYRKEHYRAPDADLPKDLNPDIPEEQLGVFSFFRQFLQTDNNNVLPGLMRMQQTLEFDIQSLTPRSKTNTQEKFISIGRAYACLRSEVQNQIRQAKADYDFDYLRFRDIFSDDLYVYYEDEHKNPIYGWQSLDSVFDFIVSIGVKPFPEIGYMPEKLSSKKQYTGWQYHPNVSTPKSEEKWKDLIRHFLTHIIERYGSAEVRTWRFDFWTSPDLQTKNPYWNETMQDFFHFYKLTYDAFYEVDSTLRLGSPNFSAISGMPWYESFFQFCYVNKIYPSHVSFHVYGCELRNKHASRQDSYAEVRSQDYSIANQDLVVEQIQQLYSIMCRTGFRSLELIVSDWNLTFLPKDFVRDTCYMGPYICNTYTKTLSLVKGLCFWSLSDIHEDAFPESRLFSGGPGMTDYRGLKKASYNTIVLLGMLGNKILKTGENFILVQKNDIYQLLLFNLAKFDFMYTYIDQSAMDEQHRYSIYNNSDTLYLNIMMHIPKGSYYIKKYEVNRDYGSAYDIWAKMGFPPALHKDPENYIRETSVPHVTYSLQDVEHTLILDEAVPTHGVMLLEVIPK